MSFKSTLFAAVAATVLAVPAFAEDMAPIMIQDAYARSSGAMAKAGAAFMQIINHTDAEDRLIAASSDIARRVELHTHKEVDGIMKMMEVEEGFTVPAGGLHSLQRGGDHVMFMGLTRPMAQGDMIEVTLTFEKAGEITVEIPVDLERKPMHGGQGMNHGGQGMMQNTASDS